MFFAAYVAPDYYALSLGLAAELGVTREALCRELSQPRAARSVG